jgi:hypothetical protein
MQKSFSGPVKDSTCLRRSSSGSGEGVLLIPMLLCSDSGESGGSMPKVFLFSAGGRKSMRESELSLGSSVAATVSC